MAEKPKCEGLSMLIIMASGGFVKYNLNTFSPKSILVQCIYYTVQYSILLGSYTALLATESATAPPSANVAQVCFIKGTVARDF